MAEAPLDVDKVIIDCVAFLMQKAKVANIIGTKISLRAGSPESRVQATKSKAIQREGVW